MRPLILLLAASLPLAASAADATGPTAVQSCTLVAKSDELGDLSSLPAACHEPITPCSTFKIPNSLIGLEAGVIQGEDHVRPWDGEERRVRSWNRSHDLRSAFANSVVWYYQQVAEEVGAETMASQLEAFDYGNADISGGITEFWLGSSLKISPAEQLDFLDRYNRGELPISARSYKILREISKQSFGRGYIEYAKTGWCPVGGMPEDGDPPEGATWANWYVGWIERGDGTWVFASAVHGPDLGRLDAKALAHRTLRREGLLPEEDGG